MFNWFSPATLSRFNPELKPPVYFCLTRCLQKRNRVRIFLQVTVLLSPSRRSSIGCARHNNWMLTRRTLSHPKLVPNPRTPKNGESLGRCNRTNTTSKGRFWLSCVLSGNPLSKLSITIASGFKKDTNLSTLAQTKLISP